MYRYCMIGDASVRVALIKPRALKYINLGLQDDKHIVDIKSIIKDLTFISAGLDETYNKSEINSIIFDLITISEAVVNTKVMFIMIFMILITIYYSVT